MYDHPFFSYESQDSKPRSKPHRDTSPQGARDASPSRPSVFPVLISLAYFLMLRKLVALRDSSSPINQTKFRPRNVSSLTFVPSFFLMVIAPDKKDSPPAVSKDLKKSNPSLKSKEPKSVINPKTGKKKKLYSNIATVDDLPESIKSRIAEHKIDRDLVQEHLMVCVNVIMCFIADHVELSSYLPLRYSRFFSYGRAE